MREAVKTALLKRNMTMTELAKSICKNRSWLTENLYNGNPSIRTTELISSELGYKLSEFIAFGESQEEPSDIFYKPTRRKNK